MLNAYGPIFDNGADITWVNTGLKIFYGLILGLAILGGIGAIVIACCSVVKARHVVYCTCTFLMMLGLISFILLMAMAVLMPNLAQICGYMDKKLSTGASTVSLFKSFQFGDAVDLYTDCMGDGNGDMITQLNDNFTDPFNSIVTISRNTLQFNDLIPSFSTDALQNPFDLGANVIDSVNISSVLDVQDTVAI